MRINYFFLFFWVGYASILPVKSQNKKSLFTIGSDKHFASEFNYAYAKNNQSDNSSKDSINAYLDLYISFRLKVKEAKALGYDTTKVFKEEFKLYKNQLEESFLTPKKEEEALVKEAYERSMWEIKASHILIMVSKEGSPTDTLSAFNKISNIRERALKGENFSELAKTSSDDPSAKINGGDLGYFSVLQMVYPFENTAYSTPVGEISKPVRTQFGYHIIKVVDKRKNEGKIKVAHIMIRSTGKNAVDIQLKATQKIEMIDSLLKNGEPWNEICKKYSEDKNSVIQNGELKPFGRGQIVPEFEKAAFDIKEINDISEPIKTPFGWHIIKLINRVPLGTYEEEQSKLAQRIKSDSRASMPRSEMLKTLKTENNFYKNEEAVLKLTQIPPSVVIKNRWSFNSSYLDNSVILFSLNTLEITSGEFLATLNNKPFDKRLGVKEQMSKLIINYEDSLIVSYEKEKLPLKYPEYAFLVQEYYDGILLFSIMEDSVWNLSMKDSLTLFNYYKDNLDNYAIKLIDTTIFSSDSQSTLEALVNETPPTIKFNDWEVLKSNLLKEYNVSPLTLQIISTNSTEGKEIVRAQSKKTGNPFIIAHKWYWIKITEMLDYPPLIEIKGKVISDYQQYLDARFIKRLKEKYPVKINKKSLNKVYANFKATN